MSTVAECGIKQATVVGMLLTKLGDDGGGGVAKCCRQSTDDHRLLITFSVQFLPRDSYAKRGICRRRVSVCVSVTLRYSIKTAKRRITQITPHDSPLTLVL